MRCGTRDKRWKNRVCIRLEMLEFEASWPSSKLIGLLFQDFPGLCAPSTRGSKEECNPDSKLRRISSFKLASAMFNPKSNNDAKWNFFSFVPCN